MTDPNDILQYSELINFIDLRLQIIYKPDLALNNLQWLIRHQTKPNQT